MKKNFYIAELNLPNTSAYTVHVFQMCNFLSKKKKNVTLLIPFVEKKINKKNKKKTTVLNMILKSFLYLIHIKK